MRVHPRAFVSSLESFEFRVTRESRRHRGSIFAELGPPCLHPEEPRIACRSSRLSSLDASPASATTLPFLIEYRAYFPLEKISLVDHEADACHAHSFPGFVAIARGKYEGDSNDSQRRQRFRPGRERGAGAGEFQGVLRDRERSAGPRNRHRVQRPAAHGRQEVPARSRHPRRRCRYPAAYAPER